ncbi:type II toxin-antitoxin system antitoxin SocA domain-containing protein [Cytobacillus sp. FSL K6-0129]|uniref:Panacea domain-containing protein n=1 Tax=Cytobacillus sp. FSL K6-0129 TaxID=2921421 RepID=UPI0030F515C6
MTVYRALDVADYIVHYCIETGKNISHLKLQKILYFLEAHYLVNDSTLFTDDISKWRLGPVVESVYHEYKEFGSNNIKYIPNRISIDDTGKVSVSSFNVDIIDEHDKNVINTIVDKYSSIGPFILVNATHEHTPWKEDEPNINNGVKGLYYNKTELRDFFIKHPNSFEV